MERRDSLKLLLVGAIGGATVAGSTSCKSDVEGLKVPLDGLGISSKYGRTPAEKEHDEEVQEEVYLNEHELSTIAVLCDIILPATDTAGAASEAEVPEFIEFIVKDIPDHQLPMRGGLMWLDIQSNSRYNKQFVDLTDEEQIAIIDDIAYPDPDNEKPDMAPGIKFFNQMRNLTLTGYYTTRMGFDDLKVNSNYANVWDGVPDHVLAKHDVEYDEEWLAKCVNQDERLTIAQWDDKGNLLT